MCHLHPYGTPVGALEADETRLHRSRQAVLETAEFPAITDDEQGEQEWSAC